tara:strand:- start:6667 stop:7290 length:624 start_codon:yes stop_codon:yes gene_type:complete
MKNLWDRYKAAVTDVFPDMYRTNRWAYWKSKGTDLVAETFGHKYFLKSRAVDITSEKSNIYNNIIYPKTGENLPCFGMDLMGFFDKKVIVVFDFQHPTENLLFGVEGLPKGKGDYRFFEPGNHFSENIYIAYCTADEVDDHLPMFKKYLTAYADMVYCKQPSGMDTSVYHDFDAYMTKLDPVGGYLSGKFGKDKAERLVKEFLFDYG